MTSAYQVVGRWPYKRLERRENGSASWIDLPDPDGFRVGFWVNPSPFPGTPPWEWVITNMPVTVVTGMSAGYTYTRSSAVLAARRALLFWQSLGYNTVPLPGAVVGGVGEPTPEEQEKQP